MYKLTFQNKSRKKTQKKPQKQTYWHQIQAVSFTRGMISMPYPLGHRLQRAHENRMPIPFGGKDCILIRSGSISSMVTTCGARNTGLNRFADAQYRYTPYHIINQFRVPRTNITNFAVCIVLIDKYQRDSLLTNILRQSGVTF